MSCRINCQFSCKHLQILDLDQLFGNFHRICAVGFFDRFDNGHQSVNSHDRIGQNRFLIVFCLIVLDEGLNVRIIITGQVDEEGAFDCAAAKSDDIRAAPAVATAEFGCDAKIPGLFKDQRRFFLHGGYKHYIRIRRFNFTQNRPEVKFIGTESFVADNFSLLFVELFNKILAQERGVIRTHLRNNSRSLGLQLFHRKLGRHRTLERIDETSAECILAHFVCFVIDSHFGVGCCGRKERHFAGFRYRSHGDGHTALTRSDDSRDLVLTDQAFCHVDCFGCIGAGIIRNQLQFFTENAACFIDLFDFHLQCIFFRLAPHRRITGQCHCMTDFDHLGRFRLAAAATCHH